MLAWVAVWQQAALVSPRVVVSGGCHGNELNGVWTLLRLDQRAAEIATSFPMLQVETLLSNPRAHDSNLRFVDCDLNRQFSDAALSQPLPECPSYEAVRAHEIAASFGSGGDREADFCIDLHTTTTNMGCTLIVGSWSPAALAAAAYVALHWARGDVEVARRFPLRVLIDPHYTKAECPYLCSVASHGIEIEVGPCAHGSLRADVSEATERAVVMVLEYLNLLSSGAAPDLPATVDAYVDRGKLPWPAGRSGVLPGVAVHPQLQVSTGRVRDRNS